MNTENLSLENLTISGIPADEQETVINFQRDGDTMTVYTSDNTMVTKLRRLVAEAPDTWRVTNITYSQRAHEPTSVTVEGPKDLLTLRTQKITRPMSEERKAEVAERLRKSRSKQ